MQTEMTIRTEWARVCQYGPNLPLGDAITLIGRGRQLWPRATGFRTSNSPHQAQKVEWGKLLILGNGRFGERKGNRAAGVTTESD